MSEGSEGLRPAMTKSKQAIIPGDLVMSVTNFNKRLDFAAKVGNSIHIDIVEKGFADGRSLKVDAWPELTLGYAEAHLMVKDPIPYLDKLKQKNITRAIIHVESTFDPSELQAVARDLDILIGFAVNPDTDLTRVTPLLAISSYVQVMGIYPGKTGQPYLAQTPLAVSYLRNLPQRLTITVDGGVSQNNIPALKTAGADYFIASSAIYDHGDWQENYQLLLNLAQA